MSNWIKTKDKHPEDGIEVLFMTRYKFVCVGKWKEKDKEWEESIEYGTFKEKDVIAWCPIPKYDLND